MMKVLDKIEPKVMTVEQAEELAETLNSEDDWTYVVEIIKAGPNEGNANVAVYDEEDVAIGHL